ncbi:hypothetical protein ACFP3Q_01700 [Nocardioides sp. GCM10027113]
MGVVAAVLLPLTLMLTGCRDDPAVGDDPAVARGPAAEAREVADGWRAESWRDLEVLVPAAWELDPPSPWCMARGADPRDPVVERPEGIRALILCNPHRGAGARFFEPGVEDPWSVEPREVPKGSDRYPAGSWAGTFVGEHVGVEVVAPTKALAEEVLASVRDGLDVDSRGCLTAIRANTDLSGPDQVDGPLTICRYASAPLGSEASYWLAESRDLSAAGSDAVRRAVEAAPRGRGALLRCHEPDSEVILLLADGGEYARVRNGRCGEHHVMTAATGGVTYHQPTDRLLELLGSPWGNLR